MAEAWTRGAGAWAAEAERAEAEEKERQSAMVAGAAEPGSFPSLREAAAAKPKKRNKGQTLTLSELASGLYVGPGGRSRGTRSSDTKGLTTDEMMMLPTGPRDRSGEEPDHGRLGGGFRDYGRNARPERERGYGVGFRGEGEGQWGSNRRPFDDDRKPSKASELDLPSRADEVDNWGSTKKFVSSAPSSSRRDRYDLGGHVSRADEVDNWGAEKKFVGPPAERRSGTFGPSNADTWGRRESYGATERDRQRPRIILDPPSRTTRDPPPPPLPSSENNVPRSKPNPFGSARPREAVLAEKGLDWRKLDSELEARSTSRPSSAHSSRPTSAHSSRPASPSLNAQSEVPHRPRPKINPFGDAKPREVLLAEQGKDWRKIDLELEHRGVERLETEEEKKLKEEINVLKELVKETVSDEGRLNGMASGVRCIEENELNLKNQIILKENQLELLSRDLDDKVRFGQRGGSRPGSAAGRSFENVERPGSRSGYSDGGRSLDSFERPISRGGEDRRADVWTRSSEERRGMRGDRERSFVDRDRFTLRDRW
eukprot:Gb_28173 [translate_table: standard]